VTTVTPRSLEIGNSQARSVQVLVNKLLESWTYGDTGFVLEGQDLHENHSNNFLLRIHPEVGVG